MKKIKNIIKIIFTVIIVLFVFIFNNRVNASTIGETFLNESSLVRGITTEGKYHQIKEMFKAIGHEVKRLKRVRFGCVTLDGLKEGEIRPLTIHEIKTFYFLSKENKNIRKRGK